MKKPASVSPIKTPEVIVRLGEPARALVVAESERNKMTHRQTVETIILQWSQGSHTRTLGAQIIEALAESGDTAKPEAPPNSPPPEEAPASNGTKARTKKAKAVRIAGKGGK